LIKKKKVESETKDVSIELQLFIFAALGKSTFVFKLSPYVIMDICYIWTQFTDTVHVLQGI